MRCPFCSYEDTKVIDSRMGNNEVRRRRECEKCQNRFTTYERAETSLYVIKRDNTKEPFNADKIYHGIHKACNKLSFTEQQLKELADKIEAKIRSLQQQEIKSSQIGKIVMKELLKLDKVAYLRFASVCKQFNDPKLFEKELEMIK